MAKKNAMGRPPEMERATFVGVRLPAKLVRRLDAFAKHDLFDVRRSDAIRYLLEDGLKRSDRKKESLR